MMNLRRMILGIWLGVAMGLLAVSDASAVESCANYEMIFARGSGATQNESAEWLAFARQARAFGRRHGAIFNVTDISYPAVAVDLTMALGAKVSAGRAFAFNDSVSQGVERVRIHYSMISLVCERTQYILVGYSQGAEVMARAAKYIPPENLLYVALLGDPGLNLPEGRGLWPDACRGLNYSSYRVFAPTCQTDNGIVSTRTPYEYPGLEGKFGLWCNADDFICGSSKNPLRTQGHMRYGNDETMAWVFLMVDRILAKTRSVGLATTTLGEAAEDSDEADEYMITARLATEEFYVLPSQNVLLDASMSNSTATDALQYY